jgi:hypothetical protein
MLRTCDTAALTRWMADSESSLLASFCKGLKADLAAVTTALTEPWSNDRRTDHRAQADETTNVWARATGPTPRPARRCRVKWQQICTEIKSEPKKGPPLTVGFTMAPVSYGSLDRDVGFGNGRKDPSRIFRSEGDDQGDLRVSRKVVRRFCDRRRPSFITSVPNSRVQLLFRPVTLRERLRMAAIALSGNSRARSPPCQYRTSTTCPSSRRMTIHAKPLEQSACA